MLTQQQISDYRRDGFLVVQDVLPADIMAAVRAEYAAVLDRLYDGWLAEGRVPAVLGFEDRLVAAYRAGCDWFQPMDISLPGDRIAADTPMHFGPAVFDMLRAAPLLDIVEQLIGPEITSNPIQHVRIKPPAEDLRTGEVRAHITRTDWHQDRAVALAEADQTDMVTVWIAVTNATVENGCLQVVPFDGPQEILPHCPKTQTAIADGFIDADKVQPLPVRAGGIVILHPLLAHASLPNTTQGIRWSFDLRFNRTGQPTGRSHFPAFVARSRNAPESTLQDWRIWQQMWQEARSRLAEAPHIDIHRWKSDAPFCA
ncbi:MAG: phytanoyl-CoA dioxygenase family protein [Rhodobacterales bacterium]|nr:phytanoyl-CoA dioxygenase family protein [Rhodobacterales bacterium]